MANSDKINLFFDQFDDVFNTIVPDIVAETATEFFKSKFSTQEWDGVPWQPLSPKYAAKKTKGRGRILTKNSFLLNSIRPSTVSSNRVTISAGNSKVPYARIHNQGLRVQGVRKVKSYTNTNFMGKGSPKKIKGHTRTVNYAMPKRQFMGNSPILNELMRARLVAALKAR